MRHGELLVTGWKMEIWCRDDLACDASPQWENALEKCLARVPQRLESANLEGSGLAFIGCGSSRPAPLPLPSSHPRCLPYTLDSSSAVCCRFEDSTALRQRASVEIYLSREGVVLLSVPGKSRFLPASFVILFLRRQNTAWSNPALIRRDAKAFQGCLLASGRLLPIVTWHRLRLPLRPDRYARQGCPRKYANRSCLSPRISSPVSLALREYGLTHQTIPTSSCLNHGNAYYLPSRQREARQVLEALLRLIPPEPVHCL